MKGSRLGGALPAPAFLPANTRREQEADYWRAMVEELVHIRRSQSESVELLGGLVRNHVLETSLNVIGPDGFVQKQWHTPFGAVAITAAKITSAYTLVSGSATAGAAPTAGIGVAQYGINGTPTNVVFPTKVFNLTGRALTVYGTVGDIFTLQVFTRPQPPA